MTKRKIQKKCLRVQNVAQTIFVSGLSTLILYVSYINRIWQWSSREAYFLSSKIISFRWRM